MTQKLYKGGRFAHPALINNRLCIKNRHDFLDQQGFFALGKEKLTPLNISDVFIRSAELLPLNRSVFEEIERGSGSDPEIFAQDPSGNVIPAWEWLPAEYEVNKKAESSLYWDGAQAEFSFSQGFNCHDGLVYHTRKALKNLNETLQDKYPEGKLVCKDVVTLSPLVRKKASYEYVNLGCSPSCNAYPNVEPIHVPDPRALKYRFAGTHLHYTIGKGIKIPSWYPHGTVVMMDKIAGLLLTALGRDLENPIRRKFYGKAGEFREKQPPKGFNAHLEYRSPGSFLLSAPQLFHFGLDIGREAFRLGLIYDGRTWPLADTAEIINNCDADAAFALIEKQKEFFVPFLKAIYPEGAQKHTWQLLKKGAKTRFEKSVEKNWLLARGIDSITIPRWRDLTF